MLNKTIAFIGPGVMAEAMIAGFRQKLAKPKNMIAAGPRAERGEELHIKYGIETTVDNASAICATSAGECTLRAAISEANNHNGSDAILFNIPGSGVRTIQLNSRLPSLWDNSGGTTIDGYSQPGAQPNTESLISNAILLIQLRGNGPSALDLMQITSAGNVIRGLSTFNARRSIWVTGSGALNNLIVGNFIGTNAAGTFGATMHVLYAYGIEIDNGASNNQVGGTSPADRKRRIPSPISSPAPSI